MVIMAAGAIILVPCALSLGEQKNEYIARGPSKPFFIINKDLKRTGLNEIQQMANADIEMEKLYSGYKLEYGDRLKVKLWGKLEADFDLFINKDGNLMIPSIGKVDVNGLTLEEAQIAIKKAIDIKYTNVEVEVSLASTPSIFVRVVGHINKPGAYLINPATSIPGVIAKAGGPNDWGSISDIMLIRDGKTVAEFSMYDFMLNPSPYDGQVILDNDSIFVPAAKNFIAMRGDVKYPGIYDSMSDISLSKAIGMAGGLVPDNRSKVKASVLRLDPEAGKAKIIREVIYDPAKGIEAKDDCKLENYDTVIVTYAVDYVPNPYRLFEKVSISGEVNAPGDYLLNENETLGSLVRKAGGLTDHAFVKGAVLARDSLAKKQDSVLGDMVKAQKGAILEAEIRLLEAPALSQDDRRLRQRVLQDRREALRIMESRCSDGRIVIDLESAMNGKADPALENGDSIVIPAIPDWVMVTGAVRNPGAVVFSEGKDLDYYLEGIGLTDSANKDGIYIIKPNGFMKTKANGYGDMSRGDIVVVPEKV